MMMKLRTAGAAEVIQIGTSWREADEHLREMILPGDENGVYIPPFDHPEIWAGAATMVDEIELQLGERSQTGLATRAAEHAAKMIAPDAIVCSVGGGGLFCGIMQGLEGSSVSQHTRVIAAETLGAESLHVSVEAKELVTLPAITSIATSLGATRVAKQALDYGLEDKVLTVVLTDDNAVEACWRFANEERILVEPACGATLAVAYTGKLKQLLPDLTAESKVVLVVCGGSNITIEILAAYRQGTASA
jgi:L-serine/L-threonine ammonia-lyase